MMRPSPPSSQQELLDRARALSGRTVASLAEEFVIQLPANLKRSKGFVGQLLELALGADAGSRAEPDFVQLGIEMKSLPVDRAGHPIESTYVCTVALEPAIEGELHWESCWLRRKLAQVLWVPVEGERTIALGERRIGYPVLWSPTAQQEQALASDWQELTDMVHMGEVESITARMGEVLQIRPKAANAASRCRAIGPEGESILTNPRGFYLRSHFTRAILEDVFGPKDTRGTLEGNRGSRAKTPC